MNYILDLLIQIRYLSKLKTVQRIFLLMLFLKFSTVSLIGHVNVENVSTVDVENLSVANSDSHELVTVLNK